MNKTTDTLTSPTELKNARRRREGSQAHVTFLGAAGESLVAHRLSLLGYAVSVPLNDQGDDLFAVNMSTDQIFRIQVKTANASRDPVGAGKAYTQFQVGGLKITHLTQKKEGLVFCFNFLVNIETSSIRSIVIPQKDFLKIYKKKSTTVAFAILTENLEGGAIYLGGTPPTTAPKAGSKKTVVNMSDKYEGKWKEFFPPTDSVKHAGQEAVGESPVTAA